MLGWRLEAIALRLEAIATRVEAITLRMECDMNLVINVTRDCSSTCSFSPESSGREPRAPPGAHHLISESVHQTTKLALIVL